MPLPLHIIRQRESRRMQRRDSIRGHAARMVFGMFFLLSLALVGLLLGSALGYASLTSDLPPVEELPVLLDPRNGLLLQPTRIYDRSGQILLAEIAPEGVERGYLSLEQFPEALVQATLAVADAHFQRHGGYSLGGWQEADIHPTLAQRLAADLLLWDEAPTARRALRERLLAAQMTAHYGRDQVLEWYLNSADYGNDAYGAEAAAQLYLGKSVRELDLGEATLLAAVSQAPALNPFDAPQAAEELRQEALQRMLEQQRITSQAASAAALAPPLIQPAPQEQVSDTTAFVNLVLEQLGQRFDSRRIRRGGLVVISTLDEDLQLQAACLLKSELARLAGDDGEIPAADGGDCEAEKFLFAEDFPGSDADASASVLILDPRSGQVLAAVGDLRAGSPGAYLQDHPAGTLLMPFLYLNGFGRGLGPATLGWDIPGGIGNFDGQYRGPVRLRSALVNDLLPPAETLLLQLGAERVRQDASLFGLDIPEGSDLLEDAIPVSLVDAAAAYGIFANQGTLAGQQLDGESIAAVTVQHVVSVDGTVWADWTDPQVQAVVSPQLAYMMTDILSDESVRLETTRLEVDFPAAVKTGRSFEAGAAWTAGYTPSRVVVVHVSSEVMPEQMAARLWQALITTLQADLPDETWSMPGGLSWVDVCDPSGLLPTAACPHVVKELFISGNEPVQADTLYRIYEINRETGLLATVYTPAEMVIERSYLIAPEEAQAWAQAAGLPAPPAEYDALQVPPVQADVRISLPTLFASINGEVEIRGTADGEDLASYRLDYGQGLNPQAWVQIGSDSTVPVRDGLLGTWDTSGLEGLYVLRLQVVRADLRLEQAMMVVTVTEP